VSEKKASSYQDLDTIVTHVDSQSPPAGNYPLTNPIYQSVKFSFSNFAQLRDFQRGTYFYSRVGNPTVRELEVLLARLQGCEAGLAVASGIATISNVLVGLLKKDDHVVVFTDSYKPTRVLVRDIMSRFGVRHTFLRFNDFAKMEEVLKSNATRMVIFESPTNPMTRIVDVRKVSDLCRKYSALSVMDNTWAGFHQHHDLGVDLYLHSLTKFASGHGDVMGGVVLGSQKLIDKLAPTFFDFGATLDPHAAYLILRGMKTYGLRFRHQTQSATSIAQFLENEMAGTYKQSVVEQVLYPGLESHPEHRLAKEQLQDFGNMILLNLKAPPKPLTAEQSWERLGMFFDSLKVFQLAGSLGSTESLVVPADHFFGGDLSKKEKEFSGLDQWSIRLSIGTESCDELKADLKQALDRLWHWDLEAR
jgi:cystathionine beta-lyase/cystathionine gamma-synthase